MRRALVPLVVIIVVGGAGAVYWLTIRSDGQSKYPEVDRALEERNFHEASKLLKSYLVDNPDDLSTLLLAAQTARRESVFLVASDYLQTYEKLNGSKDAVVLERQLARLQNGDLQEVQALLTRCDSHPDAAETPLIFEAYLMAVERHLNMPPGLQASANGPTPDLLKAIWAADRWLAKRSSRADQFFGYLVRGRIHEILKRYAEAVADLRKAVELDEENVPARMGLALLLGQAEPVESVEHIRYVVQRNPEDVNALAILAAGLRGLGRIDEARQIYDLLLQKHPNNPQFWLERGNTALDSLQFDEAEHFLRKAEKMAPNEPSVLNSIYRLLALKRNDEEAKKYRERFLQAEADAKQRSELEKKTKMRIKN